MMIIHPTIRIKTWPGGKGLVQNITFDHLEVTNAENPIVITTRKLNKKDDNGDEVTQALDWILMHDESRLLR